MSKLLENILALTVVFSFIIGVVSLINAIWSNDYLFWLKISGSSAIIFFISVKIIDLFDIGVKKEKPKPKKSFQERIKDLQREADKLN